LQRRAEFLAGEKAKAKAKTVAPKKSFPLGLVLVFSLFFLALVGAVVLNDKGADDKRLQNELLSGLMKK
jgi:hypothetical protein